MKTLWTFGDSNTAGHGCTPYFDYYKKYYKEGDKIWPEHLAHYLKLNLINMGINGGSNDVILDSIMKSFDKIKKGDSVIIGKTFSHRFDIPQKTGLVSVFWDWDKFAAKEYLNQFSKEEIETIINFQYLFMDSPLFVERWTDRYAWIKGLLETKGCKVVIWDVSKDLLEYETIISCTKRKVDDYHMSFYGHKKFSEYMYNTYFKGKTVL